MYSHSCKLKLSESEKTNRGKAFAGINRSGRKKSARTLNFRESEREHALSFHSDFIDIHYTSRIPHVSLQDAIMGSPTIKMNEAQLDTFEYSFVLFICAMHNVSRTSPLDPARRSLARWICRTEWSRRKPRMKRRSSKVSRA